MGRLSPPVLSKRGRAVRVGVPEAVGAWLPEPPCERDAEGVPLPEGLDEGVPECVWLWERVWDGVPLPGTLRVAVALGVRDCVTLPLAVGLWLAVCEGEGDALRVPEPDLLPLWDVEWVRLGVRVGLRVACTLAVPLCERVAAGERVPLPLRVSVEERVPVGVGVPDWLGVAERLADAEALGVLLWDPLLDALDDCEPVRVWLVVRLPVPVLEPVRDLVRLGDVVWLRL